jgi:hypothetical protein
MHTHYTLPQRVEAAHKLFETLSNWKFGTATLRYLKDEVPKDRGFDPKEKCLVIVVTLDSLYSTQLRFKSGLRESVANYIHENRDKWEAMANPIRAECVSQFADNFRNTTARETNQSGPRGPLSFASKFFHFFISDGYPIYDQYANVALKLACRDYSGTDYSSFFDGFQKVLKNTDGITAPMLDQYLWLVGQWESEKQPNQSKKSGEAGNSVRRIRLLETINKAKRGSTNEITQLFGKPRNEQEELLNIMTNGDYKELIRATIV